MTGKRKRYAAEFQAKIALEALRGELTTAQLATKHGLHQTMISEWKRQAGDGLASVFSGKTEAKAARRAVPGDAVVRVAADDATPAPHRF
jgi:transposase